MCKAGIAFVKIVNTLLLPSLLRSELPTSFYFRLIDILESRKKEELR